MMDKSDKNAVKNFMLPIIAGLVIFEILTVAVFAIIGKFDLRVVWGALWGTAVMIVYYLLMARAVTKAASGDPDEAKKRIQASYSARMLLLIVLMGAGLYLATSLELINWIPMLLAVIFPRISIAIWQLISGTNKMYNDDIPDAFRPDPNEPDILDSEVYKVVLSQKRSDADTSGTDNDSDDKKESED